MKPQVRLSAILIATQLDIKGIKAFIPYKPLADTAWELFYKTEGDKHLCFYNYGIVAFKGYSEEEIRFVVNSIKPYLTKETRWLRDDHDISLSEEENIQLDFDHIIVNRLDDQVVRIVMLNMAQSVALDHYHAISETLLSEVKNISKNLESSGRLTLGRNKMMRFLGKALNTQNDIAENIYIFDAPDLVWDNEYLDKLHQGLMKYFDLRIRFSEVDYTLKIIKDNLQIFREIASQRESNTLEVIIILLILLEVFDLLITKLF